MDFRIPYTTLFTIAASATATLALAQDRPWYIAISLVCAAAAYSSYRQRRRRLSESASLLT